ncbi:hypothetical protein SERLA73DRAFT_149802 [Serpula lacrymans var. lacrymans S7.3]|uniref:CCHC-type domain-containing protein n=2 Tax=Serpula lacrymans var. lacrymans TaxID=341189 RepID=F8PK69_SERL3|nr:hypothetical protein SERLA73DRAFT_149802 [Serpula lacrymans var. lacrymans S7.3]
MSYDTYRENPDMAESTDMSDLRDALPHIQPRAPSPATNQQQMQNLQNIILAAVNNAIADNNELWEERFSSKDEEVRDLRRRLAESERRQPSGMGLPRAQEAEFRKTALAKPEPYDGDKKKNRISFALSYMSIGAAAALRTEWVERRKIAEERSDAGEITLLESWAHFERTLKDHFADTHKEERARYEIIYKKQGTLTAQEFFVKFEELRRRAGYDVKRNEQFLITLIRNNINGPLIKQIIYSGNVPTTYTEWKTRIVTNDQLWRDQVENERMLKGSTNGSSGTGNRGPNGRYQEKGASEKKTETVEAKKDGTGTLYTGAGKEMEVDKQKFQTEGRCFKCGEKGHRARDHLNGQTPQKPKFDLRAMLEAMPEEERANLLQGF